MIEDLLTHIPPDHRWVMRSVGPTEHWYSQGTHYACILGPKFGMVPDPTEDDRQYRIYTAFAQSPAEALTKALDKLEAAHEYRSTDRRVEDTDADTRVPAAGIGQSNTGTGSEHETANSSE